MPASLVATATASNSVADTTIVSYLIAPNSVRVGSVFRFECSGSGSVAGSNTGTLSFWVAVNGTKIATVTGVFIGATSNGAVDAVGYLTFRAIGNASTGAVIARMAAKFFSSSGQINDTSTVPNATTAVDTTSAITVSIGMTWSAASPTNVATVDHALISQVP